VAAVAASPVAAASPTPARAKASKHPRVHAVLAKHDAKAKRSSKDPIDRLLGL
jgi:hypothetical protein